MPEDKTVSEGTEFDETELGTDSGADDGSENDNGNPGQPNGDQPVEDWESKYNSILEQNRALNKLLVEARRQANSSKNLYKPGQANDQGNGQGQPGDFNTAVRLAEADLRSELDGILDLYPELPANMVKLIRSNPWGYSSRDSFLGLNVANALLDIETFVADYVAGLSPETPSAQVPQAPAKAPASKMKPNAAPVGGEDDEDVVPGSQEDTNPFTMPLDKLERRVNRKFKPTK